MKKYLFAVFAAMLCMSAVAQETVKELYVGDPANVTWDNTLKIDASDFDGVSVGNYIYITFSRTSDVIELKSDGQWLPGCIKTVLGENASDFRCYITEDGLAKLQEYGLEICGADFTVTGVSVMNDGFVMPAGAIWGGYFWVENWNTLELYKTAFDKYSGQRYLVINFAADKGDFSNYVMNVMTEFDNDAARWEPVSKESAMAVVDLQDINVTERLANYDALFIQSNPEGNAPFNITSVVLTDSGTTGVQTVGDDETDNGSVDVYNLYGMAVRVNVSVSDATAGLPAGIYIVGGKKVAVR